MLFLSFPLLLLKLLILYLQLCAGIRNLRILDLRKHGAWHV